MQSFLRDNSFRRLFHTLRYLKWQQIFYRFYYPVKAIFYSDFIPSQKQLDKIPCFPPITFPVFSCQQNLFVAPNNQFVFLNKTKTFGSSVDWTFKEYGMLWSFHLHYFDWLNDKEIGENEKLATIKDWIAQNDKSLLFTHSYPASLRLVNWIKFLVAHQIKDTSINASIYSQAKRLYHFPEYHLMGNHLLENAVSLVWAGVYLGDIQLKNFGLQLLNRELKEQILEDGAHFEKSISYHSFILKNLLELKLFLSATKDYNVFYKLLEINIIDIISFLFTMGDGLNSLPHFGDSNERMLVNINELCFVAQNLMLFPKEIVLSDSGFRRFDVGNFRLFFNSGLSKADYQPGHFHADTFSFCLFVDGQPVIVDRGVSTYEHSKERLAERGTAAHNTICVNNENSSDVWAAFRMGKRPVVKIEKDSPDEISCVHDAYKSKYDILHRRQIRIGEFSIEITDALECIGRNNAMIYMHFYPGIYPEKNGTEWHLNKGGIKIMLDCKESWVEEYQYCIGINETISAYRIAGRITESRTNTVISVKNGEINRHRSRGTPQFH
ncbi:MAG: alginate lyase family protein [Chitinophagaceae bacterium]